MEQFKITDGTTEVDFVADSDFGLLKWPLRIAPFRRSRLSERSPYDSVQESLTIFITGSSGQDAQANLVTLIGLLDQSQRFANNRADVAPVKLVFQPTSSTGDTYECLILGNNNSPMVSLPDEYVMSGVTQFADQVRITFIREGLWLKTTEETVSVTSLTSEGVRAVTFASTPGAYSPLKMTFTLDASGAHKGYACFADSAYADINASAVNMSATSTNWQTVSGVSVSPSVSTGKLMRAFVKLKNNSSIVSWQVGVSDGTGQIKTGIEIVPAGATDRQIIAFPPVAFLGGTGIGQVRVKADQVSGSETISVKDIIVLVGDANVFFFDFTSSYILLDTTTVTIDHRMLTAAAPIVTESGGFGVAGGGAAGMFSNKGSGYIAIIGLTDAAWTLDMVGTGSAIQTLKRYVGALLPA